MKTNSKNIALGGVVAALSLVLMFLTSVLPFGVYAFPTFAGILLVVIVIEIGYSWAVSVFVVVALLSFLFVANKEAALYYAAFLGFYPIIKSLLERINKKWLCYLLKFSIFNICVIIAFYIGIAVLSIPSESFKLFGLYLPWLFLIIGNIFFILYDVCVTRLVTLYLYKYHKFFSRNK